MATVVRILVYEGSEEWIEATLNRSLKGTHEFSRGCSITSIVPSRVQDDEWKPWYSDLIKIDTKGGD